MTHTNANPAPMVPPAIVAKLRGVIARTRRVVAIRGACATAAAAIGAVLVVMAVDACLMILQDAFRWALSAWALAMTLLAAYVFLVRPLARSFTLTGIARMIESRHPEMHERISSALQLLTSKDRPDLRGSDALIAALASEACLEADALKLNREVAMRSVRPVVFVLTGVVAALLVPLLVWPDKTGRLLARAVAPGANLPNIHAQDLQVTPGGKTIVQGERLEITVLVKDARVQAAQLRTSSGDGTENVVAMTPAGGLEGGSRFTFTCPPAGESFRYRVLAGDALSGFYSVRVVPPPALRQISLRYEYPEYTHLPSHTEYAAGDIRAVMGTRVLVTLKGNKPLASAQAIIRSQAGQEIEAKLSPDNTEASLTLELTPDLNGQWAIRLSDTLGFQVLLPSGAIQSMRDRPPTARILLPREASLRLGREDRLPLVYTVADDHGISSCQLVLKTENGQLEPIDLSPLAKSARRAWEGKFMLDLSRLRLADAGTLSVQVRAADNLPAGSKGPQQGLSDPLTVQLDSAAPSYVMQAQMADELRIRAVLEETGKHLADAKRESSPLQKVMPRLEELNAPALERIERLRESLTKAGKPLRELIARIAGGNFAPLTVKLAELADDHIAKANGLAGQLKLTDSMKERAESADEADFQVDRATSIVSDMLKDLSVMTELAKRSQALVDLAQRQQELAAQKAALDLAHMVSTNPASTTMPASAPPGATAANWTPQAQKDWQRRQATLAAAMTDLVKQTRGALGMRAGEEKNNTRNLAEDARELAKRQAALSEETVKTIQRDQVMAALRGLAGQQGDLAKETDKDSATCGLADVGKAMAELSAELGNPSEQTSAKLAVADRQLQGKASLNQQRKTAVAVLDQARQIAARQRTISREVAAAAKVAQDESACVATSRKRLADLSRKVEQIAAGSGNQLADLELAQSQARKDQASHEQALAGAVARLAVQRQPQEKLSRQADAISRELSQATVEARQAGAGSRLTAKLREASRLAGQAGRHAQADHASQNALQQADDFVRALAGAVGPNPPTAAQSDRIAARISEIQRRQSQIHQQARGLMAQSAQLANHQRQSVLARLKAEQNSLAKQVETISDRVKELAPQADRLDTTVARAAAQVSLEIESSRLAQAAATADQAATGLFQLASRLSATAEDLAEPSPTSFPATQAAGLDKSSRVVVKGANQQEPEQIRATQAIAKTREKEMLAANIAALARRQRQLAGDMQAMAQDRLGEIIVSRQGSIVADTADLYRDVELLREHSVELIPQPRIRALAEEAVGEITGAQSHQQRARKAMGDKMLPASLAPQRESAAALVRAAQALEQLGQQLAQAAAKDAPPADEREREESGYLARAAEQADIAARTEDVKDALRAAKLLAELAGLASNRARQGGVMPLDMAQIMNSRRGIGRFFGLGAGGYGGVELGPEQLESMGISMTDWAKLPGELRDEVLQAAGDTAPEEYRTLIKQYFQEIARRGGATNNTNEHK